MSRADHLPPEAVKLFDALADAQRGEPEYIMRRMQECVSGGYTWTLMHVGDLTHRMSEHINFYHGNYGNVKDKVEKTLYWLNSEWHGGMPFEVDMEGQIRSAARSLGVPYEEKRAELVRLGRRFAKAHGDLPVFNEVQGLARMAAVAMGTMDFDLARACLSSLKAYLDEGREAWQARAMQYPAGPNPNRGVKNPSLVASRGAVWSPAVGGIKLKDMLTGDPSWGEQLSEENVVNVGPFPPFFDPPGTYIIYFVPNAESRQALLDVITGKDTRHKIPVFGLTRTFMGPGTIDQLWHTTFAKRHVAAAMKYTVQKDKNRVIVSHIGVKKAWRGNRIATFLLDQIKEGFPGLEVLGHELTDEGRALFKAWGKGREFVDTDYGKAGPKSNPSHYWGRSAAGVLLTCEDKVFLVLRSQHVQEPGTWGIPGGSISGEAMFPRARGFEAPIQDDLDVARKGALRELQEELGPLPESMDLDEQDVITYRDKGFTYTTFVMAMWPERARRLEAGITLNWENDAFGWFTTEEALALPNLHFGARYVLEQLGR